MNRRDFFKLAGLALAGCVAPQWAERQEEMQIGDLLAKIGRGETLSLAEQQEIRIWGNNAQLLNNFVSGIQSPDGQILGGKINFPVSPIFSGVLESDTASLNILVPSMYNHLIIWSAGRCTTGGTGNEALLARYNSDSGNNYSTEILYGIGALSGAQTSGIVNAAIIGGLAKDGEATGVNGSGIVFIPNIRSSFYKSTLSLFSPASPTDIFVQSCVWSSSTVLSNISILAGTGSIKAGSVISIYGLT